MMFLMILFTGHLIRLTLSILYFNYRILCKITSLGNYFKLLYEKSNSDVKSMLQLFRDSFMNNASEKLHDIWEVFPKVRLLNVLICFYAGWLGMIIWCRL